jgi:hypothetical protein
MNAGQSKKKEKILEMMNSETPRKLKMERLKI